MHCCVWKLHVDNCPICGGHGCRKKSCGSHIEGGKPRMRKRACSLVRQNCVAQLSAVERGPLLAAPVPRRKSVNLCTSYLYKFFLSALLSRLSSWSLGRRGPVTNSPPHRIHAFTTFCFPRISSTQSILTTVNMKTRLSWLSAPYSVQALPVVPTP